MCVFFLSISNPNQSYSLSFSVKWPWPLVESNYLKLEPIFIVTLLPSFFLLQCKKNMQIIKQIDKNLLLLKPTPSDWTKPKKKKKNVERKQFLATYHIPCSLHAKYTHTHTHTQIDSSRFIQIIIIKTNDQDQTNHEQQQQQMTTKTLNIV